MPLLHYSIRKSNYILSHICITKYILRVLETFSLLCKFIYCSYECSFYFIELCHKLLFAVILCSIHYIITLNNLSINGGLPEDCCLLPRSWLAQIVAFNGQCLINLQCATFFPGNSFLMYVHTWHNYQSRSNIQCISVWESDWKKAWESVW